MAEKFQEHFGNMTDPRVERTKLYPLEEILFVLLCGSVCGAESWRDFVMFWQEKLDFLREYFPFSAGIPCKNTFARVTAALDPEQFRACFIAWTASLQVVPGEVIAIDGKTLRNSGDESSSTADIHMVSAYGTHSRLVLAQQKVSEKSNEITAIPAVLELLNVTDHIITIDAMGCQRSIAKKIRDKEADYVLALKGNQGTLSEDVRLFLETQAAKPVSTAISDTYSEADAGHGRIETRKCIVSSQIDWLEQKPSWSGLPMPGKLPRRYAPIGPLRTRCTGRSMSCSMKTSQRSAQTMRPRTWPSCVMWCSICSTPQKNISRASGSRHCAKKQAGGMTTCG